jgi:cobyrinic acid a,c-diamide synthase
MGNRYWVIGGEYLDTAFKQLAPGTEEEVLGPFKTYDDAKIAWQKRAWSTVDDCTKRYRIEQDKGPSMPKRFYVVGGDYVDSGFHQLVEGTAEERLGPFADYDAAHDAWQKRAWETVDSCTKRFRIVEETAV